MSTRLLMGTNSVTPEHILSIGRECTRDTSAMTSGTGVKAVFDVVAARVVTLELAWCVFANVPPPCFVVGLSADSTLSPVALALLWGW